MVEERVNPPDDSHCQGLNLQRVDAEHGHYGRHVTVGTRNCACRRCLMSLGKHGTSYFQVERTIFHHLPPPTLQQSLECLTFRALGATGARKLFLESHEVVRDLLDDWDNMASECQVRARRARHSSPSEPFRRPQGVTQCVAFNRAAVAGGQVGNFSLGIAVMMYL